MSTENNEIKKQRGLFFKENYFLRLYEDAQEAISKIDTSRREEYSDEERNLLRNEGRTSLENILVETGLRDPEHSFFNADVELYSENGDKDQEKRERLLKDIIGYAGYQQYQWAFYPTTRMMSAVTERNMEAMGQDYESMLPTYIRNTRKHKKDLSSEKKDTVKAYLYTDGSISQKWSREKGTVSFTRLGFNTGFDYNAPYDPNYENPGKAGFNPDGYWEQMDSPAHEVSVDFARGVVNTIRLVYVSDDEIFLIDEDGIFTDEKITEYFDMKGNLYGATTVDRTKTADAITNQLVYLGVDKISGIITGANKKKDTIISSYESYFSNSINKKTKIYFANDPEPWDKIKRFQELQEKEQTERLLTVTTIAAARIGLKGNDYVELLSGNRDFVEAPVNIFTDDDTMEQVLSHPVLALTQEERTEVRNELKKESIPEEYQQQLSNLIITTLNNRSQIYRNGGKVSAVEMVRQAIVYGKMDKETLLKEEAIASVVQDVVAHEDTSVVENDTQYFLFDEKQRSEWIERKLSDEITTEEKQRLNEVLDTLHLPEGLDEKKTSTRIKKLFNNFSDLKSKYGLKPDELPVLAIKKMPENRNELIINKRFDEYLENLWAMEKNRNINMPIMNAGNSLQVSKKDIATLAGLIPVSSVHNADDPYHDIFTKEGLEAWSSEDLPLYIPEAAIQETVKAIQALDVPLHRKKEISKKLQEAYPHYRTIAMSTGLKPSELAYAVEAMAENKPAAVKYKNKQISLSAAPEVIFTAAMKDTPAVRTVNAKDLYEKSSGLAMENETVSAAEAAGLYEEKDLKAMLRTLAVTEMPDYTDVLSSADTKDINRLLRSSRIPISKSTPFRRDLKKAIARYFGGSIKKGQYDGEPMMQAAAKKGRRPTKTQEGRQLTQIIKEFIEKAGGGTGLGTALPAGGKVQAIKQLGLQEKHIPEQLKQSFSSHFDHPKRETIITPVTKELSMKKSTGSTKYFRPAAGNGLTQLAYALVDTPAGPARIDLGSSHTYSQASNRKRQQHRNTIPTISVIPPNDNEGKSVDVPMNYTSKAKYVPVQRGTHDIEKDFSGGADRMERIQGKIMPVRKDTPLHGTISGHGPFTEAARLARINANYEADKAMMEQERAHGQPVLRRSASHDVGGAGGSTDKEGNIIDEASEELSEEIIQRLKDHM